MRKRSFGPMMLVLVLLATLLPATLAVAGPATPRNFTTSLSAAEEVADPPVVSRARGQASFRLSKDGTELSFKLIVANIENVSMAHLHLAPAGANGPVVVWLYPEGPPPVPIAGRTQGVLATGTITADDLVGPLAGASLDDLVDAIRTGNVYVNVHTAQYPAGEVRGQL